MLKNRFYAGVGLVVALAATVAVLVWLVVADPGDTVDREQIKRILAVESPVYYRDGLNLVGVFFQDDHRRYVPYREIPPDFVNALLAAEDNGFFSHYGIDWQAIVRATLANLKAGRVVQGGSTITQQTAKNLFKRKDRSLLAKIKELLYAWRLEYNFSKEDIFEFYANQFYVSGNGRGLGVAARYYFDKPVAELDTLECAFIAASVKRPNFYNPFIQKSDEAAARARREAKVRTAYVLDQMLRLGLIAAESHQANIAREIPFRQGRFSYALNTILDLVREGLAEPEVVEALSRHGVDNVATSGIRIITTVEQDIQEAAVAALRRTLSRLDVQLRGYDHRAIQQVYAAGNLGLDSEPRPGAFLVGRVAAVEGKGKAPVVRVSLDRDLESVDGFIDRAGLLSLANSLARYQQQRWAEASNADLAALVGELGVGDLVLVSVRGREAESGQWLFDLEKLPELQGGVLAMREGAIRAMAGGMENRHYNRAIAARRSMGSVMKPLVYAAALQLGWNSADLLNNRRNFFVYQNLAYFPRPDHDSPHDRVSMSWAGALSENLASVWLLYHLCDHLPPSRFAEVTEQLGLAPRADESYQVYLARIRDKMGVVVDRNALLRTAFEQAVELVEADLLFAGRADEYEALRHFRYGLGFDRFQAEVEREFAGAAGSDAEEGRLRLAILKNHNFLRFQGLRHNLREMAARAAISGRPVGLFHDPAKDRYVYAEEGHKPGWRPVDGRKLEAALTAAGDPERFWEEVMVEGVVRATTIDLVAAAIDEEYRRLSAVPAYSPEVLYQVRDFRVLVALNYLIGMGRVLGIESPLEPVLSFPLGSNVISLLEVTRAYEALQHGKLYRDESAAGGSAPLIIERIEHSDGEVIYQPERAPQQVYDPRIALAVSDILHNVVRHGTGRSAYNFIRLRSSVPAQQEHLAELDLRLPIFGKTGTSNRFTNAAFAGFLPDPADDHSLSPVSGYALSAYVGFDDNRPMVRRSTRISGALGALPVWARLADAIFYHRDYPAGLDLADFAFSGLSEVPLAYPALGQVEIPVEDGQGGVVSNESGSGGKATIITFGRRSANGRFEPERFFQPYWRETGEAR